MVCGVCSGVAVCPSARKRGGGGAEGVDVFPAAAALRLSLGVPVRRSAAECVPLCVKCKCLFSQLPPTLQIELSGAFYLIMGPLP